MEHYNAESEEYKRLYKGPYGHDTLYEKFSKEKPRYDIAGRRPKSWFNRKVRRSKVPNAYGKLYTEPGYAPSYTYGVFDEQDIPDKSTIKYSKTLANLKRDFDDPVRKEEVLSDDIEGLKAASCMEDLGFTEHYYEQLKESLIADKMVEALQIALLKNNYIIGRSFCSYISLSKENAKWYHDQIKASEIRYTS